MESGDICPECGRGVMRVHNTKLTRDRRHRKQYLKCQECNARDQCAFPVDELGRRTYGDDPAELKVIIAKQAALIERLIGSQANADRKYYA